MSALVWVLIVQGVALADFPSQENCDQAASLIAESVYENSFWLRARIDGFVDGEAWVVTLDDHETFRAICKGKP